jgi:hypothetical protein
LENKLHREFENYKVNKVNPRKEFFKIDIDTITQKVYEYDPSAYIEKIIEAKEYRKSLAIDKHCELNP